MLREDCVLARIVVGSHDSRLAFLCAAAMLVARSGGPCCGPVDTYGFLAG